MAVPHRGHHAPPGETGRKFMPRAWPRLVMTRFESRSGFAAWRIMAKAAISLEKRRAVSAYSPRDATHNLAALVDHSFLSALANRTCADPSTSCEPPESTSHTRFDEKRPCSLRQNNTRKTRLATRISLHGASHLRKTDTCDAHVHHSIRGSFPPGDMSSCSSLFCIVSCAVGCRAGEEDDECPSCISWMPSNAAPPAWR